jgi:hypothetical protein
MLHLPELELESWKTKQREKEPQEVQKKQQWDLEGKTKIV